MPSSRSSAEVSDIVNTVREPLRSLEEPTRRRQQVEAGTFPFQNVLPKELGTPVVSRRRNVTHVSELMESILSWPLRFRVNLARGGPVAEREANRLEAFFAHAYYRCDPSGYHRWRVRADMVRSPYGAMWLSVNPHNPPKQKRGESNKDWQKRVDDYEAAYWRWALSTPAWDTAAMTRRDGEISLAVLDEKIPIVDLCDQFGIDKDTRPLRLLAKELPNIRGEDGRSPDDGNAWLHSSVRRVTIDDGSRICYYIEQENSSGRDSGSGKFYAGKQYIEVGDPYRNTFGMPSLILFPGVERPHAPIEERYEGLNAAMCEVEYDLTMFESIALTIAANPRFAVSLPEEVAKAAMQATAIDPERMTETDLELWQRSEDESGAMVVPQLRGPLENAMWKLGPEFTMAYEGKRQQWQELNAKLSALGISPEEVTQGTAAAVLAKQDAGVRAFERPHNVISTGFQQFARMIANDAVYGLNPHLVKGGPKEGLDKPISFKAIGQEARTSKALKPGDSFEIAPSDFMQFVNGTASVTVEVVASTPAQRAAAVQLAAEAKQMGYGTLADVVEASGETDVTEKLKQIAAEKNAELLGPGMATWGTRDAIRRISLREERDEQVLLATWLPQPEQPAPQTVDTSANPTYRPPPSPVPGAETRGGPV